MNFFDELGRQQAAVILVKKAIVDFEIFRRPIPQGDDEAAAAPQMPFQAA